MNASLGTSPGSYLKLKKKVENASITQIILIIIKEYAFLIINNLYKTLNNLVVSSEA